MRKLNLRLFDGGVPAAAVTGTENAGGGTLPLNNNQTGVQVQYGKTANEGQAAADQKPTTHTTSDALQAKNAEFENLIKGDYKDQFTKKTQSIIDQRFKDYKTLQENNSNMSKVMSEVAKRYGVEMTDYDGLMKAIAQDTSYLEKEAMEMGISVEQLKHLRDVEAENAELRRITEEANNQKKIDEIYVKWMEDAERVKAIYPTFDFATEAQNKKFTDLLRVGIDVQTAYQVLHQDEIIGGAMQYTAQTIAQKQAQNIERRAQRPSENGTSGQASVVTKNDVNKLTREDRREIARRARSGETISF